MTKRMSILLVVLTIVSGLIGGAITGRIFTPKVAIAEEATQSKILTVEGLRVIDEGGEEIMYLGKLAVDKSVMRQPAILNAYGLSDSRGLYIYDNNGNAGITLGMFKSGGFVLASNKDGRGIAMMCAEDSGGAVTVNKDGKVGAMMSIEDSGGALSVFNKDGKLKAEMRVNKYGSGDIGRWDKNGSKVK